MDISSFHRSLAESSDVPTASPTQDFEDGPIAQFSSVMLFLCITAIVGALVQGLAPRRLLRAVPHPVIIMILFMLFGVIVRFSLTKAETNFSVKHYIDPLMIQTLFLPLLMAADLFRMNTRAFFICLGQNVLLAAPGLMICSLLTALFPMYVMPGRPGFDFYLALSFGGMLSSTDPIAVIITVNELAAPKRLAATVGGESLLNDGMSIIIVELFLDLRNTAKAAELDAGAIILFIFNQMLFSVFLGTGIGLATIFIIRLIREDANALITLCVVVPLLTYVVSAYFMESSGVLAVVPVGVLLNEFGRGLMIENVEHIERLYDQLSFIATTWLYAVSGYVMGEALALDEIMAVDWGSLFILYFWINIARFIMIFLAYPLLKRMGYGYSIAECVLLAWGGLRGAVGLTLALMIKEDPEVSVSEGALVQFFMCGCILLMTFNGVTTPYVLKKLKLDAKPNPILLEELYEKMSERCVVPLQNAGVSKDRARWMSYGSKATGRQSRRRSGNNMRDSANAEAERERDGCSVHTLTHVKVNNVLLAEQRKHLVMAQRHIFQRLLARGLLNREAWYILDRSADRQLEKNKFPMDQFRLVVERVSVIVKAASKLTHWSRKSIPCKLLVFLMDMGDKDVTEYLDDGDDGSPQTQEARDVALPSPAAATNNNQVFRSHDSSANGQDNDYDDGDTDDTMEKWCTIGVRDTVHIAEHPSRTFGVTFTADNWAMNFLIASWGFLYAQHHSREVVDELFTATPDMVAFEAERQALHEEITHGCSLPARFINAVGAFAPEFMERIKKMHTLAEAKNQLYQCIHEINNNGLIERHEMKMLIAHAERTIKRIKRQKFELKPPVTVGNFGELLTINPNFFPFPSFADTDSVKKEQEEEQQDETEVVGERRPHTFPEYDLQAHHITAPPHFPAQYQAQVTLEHGPHIMGRPRFRDPLKLDDTELKRY